MHVDYDLISGDLPAQCIEDCSHSGDCLGDTVYWRAKLNLTVNRERAIQCLHGYGAWEDVELAEMTDERLAETILWLACGTFSDGGDLFVLE